MDRRGENLVRPLMLAIGLHIILLSTFFIAVSPEAKTITPPPVVVIQATELTFAPSAAAEARAKKQQAEADRKKREAEEKKRQEEAKKKAAEKKKQEKAQKKAEEKKRQEEAQKKAEAKRQAELKKAEEAKQKAVEEAKAKAKKAEEAKAKAAAEAKAKAAAEADQKAKAEALKKQAALEAERQQKEKAIEEAFKQAEAEARALEELKKKEEAELAVLNALASEKAAANVLDAMTTRITRAWRRPVAFKGGLEVYLRMSLASNGELVDVRVVKTSGDVLFDRSALTAVQRAAPFDEVKQFDAATFEEKFRSLTVKFRPED
jgi:colicin import membrane protein